ncbi:hypothetical protein ACRRHK_002926 [Vibrio fluvialis]
MGLVKDNALKIKNRAYKKAMIEFQNRYYDQVSIPCGLTRLGARKRRLTRKEWCAEKNNSALLKQERSRSELIIIENNKLINENRRLVKRLKTSSSKSMVYMPRGGETKDGYR